MAATDKVTQLLADGTFRRIPDGGVAEVGSGIQSTTGNLTITAAVGSSVVFNEAAANVDVRMEGVGQPNLFFLDASADFLGFANNNPTSLLDMAGAFTIRGMAAPAVSPAGQARLYFDSTANRLQVSEHGGAYTALPVGSGAVGQVTTWGAGGTLAGENNLFWDAANDRLGIRTATPTSAFELATGQAAFPLGTVLLPGIALLGDLDTGLASTVANELQIVSGGNTRVTAATAGVTLTGNVEEIASQSGTTLFTRWNNTGAALNAKRWAMYLDTAVNGNALRFVTEDDALTTFAEVLSMSRVGNVGIGTASAGAKLDVRGSVTINDDAADADVRIEGQADANLFTTDASTNRVGVGVAAPLAKFHVQGAGPGTTLGASPLVSFWDTTAEAINVGPELLLASTTVGGAPGGLASVHAGKENATASNNASYLRFGTKANGGALTEHFRIGSAEAVFNDNAQNYDFRIEGQTEANLLVVDASANGVGFGTATPAGRVEIRDDTATVNLILTKSGVTGQNDLMEFRTDAFSGAERHLLRWTTTSGSIVTGRYGMEFDATFNTIDFVWRDQFDVAATTIETMRLKGNGNLGLGTSSPTSRFDLNGAFTIRGIAAPALSPATQGRIYFDSTANKWKISENGGAYQDLLGAGAVSGSGAATRIAFWTGATVLASDSDLIWDSTNNRLGIAVGASPNTALDLSGAISIRATTAPAIAPATQGRLYFDSGTNKWRISENGSAYQDLLGVGGVSGSGANGRMAFWNGVTALTSDADLFWDDANDFLGVNQGTPTSNLHVTGSVATATVTISGNTTLDATHHTVLGDATGGNITFTLPLASTCAGRAYWVKKIDVSSNTVTVTRTGADTIDGTTSRIIASQWEAYVFKSDGALWYEF
jgi:hypothetical protein